MEIKGKVVEINLDTQVPKNGGGTYPGATISFRDANGKLQEKGFHANALKFNSALKNGLENLQAGDNFVANADKNDNGFWEWKSIAKAGDGGSAFTSAKMPASNPVKAAASTGGNSSTYATAEERAQTQVYIVRQSSLTNALKLLEVQGNKKATTEDVIALASEFEAFVLGIEKRPDIKPGKLAVVGGSESFAKNDDPFNDIENDVPY